MKFDVLKKITLVSGLCFIFGSCAIQKSRIVRLTPDQMKTLKYLQEKELTFCELEAVVENQRGANYDTTNCGRVKFCGASRDEVLKYIRRYRDEDWCLSSPFFSSNNIPSQDVSYTMQCVTNGTWSSQSSSPNPYDNHESFDARFMDIPIEQLENYLCFVKNNPQTSTANICRFYYMKYDENLPLEKYRNKHTLAIVPVYLTTNGDGGIVTQEFTEDYKTVDGSISSAILAIGLGEECTYSPMLNHNHLCPPFNDCTKNTLLYEIDQHP